MKLLVQMWFVIVAITLKMGKPNKFKLQIIELLLIAGIGIATVIFNPPLPLLAFPFVAIGGMRGVFSTLERGCD